MTWIGALRKAILGETSIIPIGVVTIITAALLLRHADGWADWGGPALLAAVLTLAISSTATKR